MRYRTVSALSLVALLVVSAVAATAPAAATPSQSVTPAVADGPGDTYDDTAFLALDEAGGGDVVAGGQTGLRSPNATLSRLRADGSTDWTRRFAGPNATRIVDVTVADDGDVYYLMSRRPAAPTADDEGDVVVGRATADGDLTWQTTVNASVRFGRGATIAASDDGVAVAHVVSDGEVRLTEVVGGEPTWEATYGVDGAPTALRTTDDGYLLTGAESFGTPWVLRTGMSGQERLNATLPGVEAQQVVGATPTDDGGVLLAGWRTPTFGGYSASAWAARIDSDGYTRWSRVYGAGSDLRVTDVFARDDGLVLVGQSGAGSTGDGELALLGVGADGAQTFDHRVAAVPYLTAATLSGDSVRVAGVTGIGQGGFNGTLRSVALPEAGVGDAGLSPDATVDSNGTFYRGQNLRLADPGERTETYDLVRLPDEGDAFDPHVVRRVTLDGDGTAVIESATLPAGTYVLRTTDGETVSVADGRISRAVGDDPVAFTLRSQQFYRVETNRTFVDATAGERGVSLRLDSDRTDYDVYVSADRYAGGPVDAATLRAALGDVQGFEGVERVDGRPVARIAMGDRSRINASAAALGAGLYEVTVSSVDTRDAGAVATTRVVVADDSGSQLGLALGNRTLRLPVGGEAETNVTLTNVTDGVAALSMSANMTGEPLVSLRLDADVNASYASGSAGYGSDRVTAGAAAFDGNTGNGSVVVGTVGVSAQQWAPEENATGTNAMTFRVDWVVGEDGVPYSLPDEVTVTVHVVPAENGTSGSGGGSGSDGGGTGEGSGAGGSGSGSSGGSSSGSESGGAA